MLCAHAAFLPMRVSGLPEPLRRVADLSDRGLFGSCGRLLLYRCSDDREAQKHCSYCQ